MKRSFAVVPFGPSRPIVMRCMKGTVDSPTQTSHSVDADEVWPPEGWRMTSATGGAGYVAKLAST